MAEDQLPGPGVLDVWVLQGEEEPLDADGGDPEAAEGKAARAATAAIEARN